MSTTLFVLPELDLDGPLLVSQWLARRGTKVIEGDRLLEVLAGDVTVDIPAPASGVLLQKLVREDDLIEPGQVLGLICQQELTPR